MDNLNSIPNSGNWGDAASKLNDNFNKVKQAVTTVENASKNNKGYFSSLSALNTAFPSPKPGQTAYVYDNATSNYIIYNAVNGLWTTQSVTAPPIGVAVNDYAKHGGSSKTLKQVDDEIVQLADEVVIKNELLDLPVNIFDPTKITSGGHYNIGLAWVTVSAANQSQFFPIKMGDVFRVKVPNNLTTNYPIVFKDHNGNLAYAMQQLPSAEGLITINITTNNYSSFSLMVYSSALSGLMVTKNQNIPQTYLPFTETKLKGVKVTKDNLGEDLLEIQTFENTTGANSNIINLDNVIFGGSYRPISPFPWVPSESFCSTEFIPCVAGDVFYLKSPAGYTQYDIVLKNASGVIIEGAQKSTVDGILTITPASGYSSFAVMLYKSQLYKTMLSKNQPPPAQYVPYQGLIEFKQNFKYSLDKNIEQIAIDKKNIEDAPQLDGYLADRVLIWEDDFEGSEIDRNEWNLTYRRYTVPPQSQMEFNTDREKNVRVKDSKLYLTARRENYKGSIWTSAQINTNDKREFKYGRIEVKAKLTRGRGFWPAFWLLGANLDITTNDEGVASNNGAYPYCGEVDIYEHYNLNTSVSSVVHWMDINGGISSSVVANSPEIAISSFNVYSVEWTENTIKFLVNNVVYETMNVEDATINGYNPFRQPMYIILNFAIRNVPAEGSVPDATTPSPADMVIDWVRVYAPSGSIEYKEVSSVSVSERPISVDAEGIIGISIDNTLIPASDLQMNIGEKKLLVGVIEPVDASDHTLLWESSNEDVAVCRGGVVEAINSGSCTIEVTTHNFKKAKINLLVI